jgi:YgiT-type zinc finger domain-containing protein
MCKGTVQDGFSNFTADMGGCIVIIKNVPSRICRQCGEASYSDETARRLEEIVHSLTNPINAEIAVVTYTIQAA